MPTQCHREVRLGFGRAPGEPQPCSDFRRRTVDRLAANGPTPGFLLVDLGNPVHRPRTARLVVRDLTILRTQCSDQVVVGEMLPVERSQHPGQPGTGRDTLHILGNRWIEHMFDVIR